jgi:hypothetical protein
MPAGGISNGISGSKLKNTIHLKISQTKKKTYDLTSLGIVILFI